MHGRRGQGSRRVGKGFGRCNHGSSSQGEDKKQDAEEKPAA